MPVAETRCPTSFFRPVGSENPISETGVAFFFRNPDFQLRDFGALAPSVSVRRNSFSSTVVSRQPVIVTGASFAWLASAAVGAIAGAFAGAGPFATMSMFDAGFAAAADFDFSTTECSAAAFAGGCV